MRSICEDAASMSDHDANPHADQPPGGAPNHGDDAGGDEWGDASALSPFALGGFRLLWASALSWVMTRELRILVTSFWLYETTGEATQLALIGVAVAVAVGLGVGLAVDAGAVAVGAAVGSVPPPPPVLGEAVGSGVAVVTTVPVPVPVPTSTALGAVADASTVAVSATACSFADSEVESSLDPSSPTVVASTTITAAAIAMLANANSAERWRLIEAPPEHPIRSHSRSRATQLRN